jgi:hypothetical protein
MTIQRKTVIGKPRGSGSSQDQATRLFDIVVESLMKEPGVSSARMFGAIGLKNKKGKFFAMLYKGELVVKLPKGRVEQLVKSKGAKHFDPGHGRIMKEWVAIESGKNAENEWLNLANEAKDFVNSIKK